MHTPRAVMPAEGGVIGRGFRKRDEEKFARHLGLFPSSSKAETALRLQDRRGPPSELTPSSELRITEAAKRGRRARRRSPGRAVVSPKRSRALSRFVRSRRQLETGAHLCSGRFVSSDLASSGRLGGRAIGGSGGRGGAQAETRFHFHRSITSVVPWLVVSRFRSSSSGQSAPAAGSAYAGHEQAVSRRRRGARPSRRELLGARPLRSAARRLGLPTTSRQQRSRADRRAARRRD